MNVALGSMLAVAVGGAALFFALVAYLYDPDVVPAGWKPTSTTYPPSVRIALWQDMMGRGTPHVPPQSPSSLALRGAWELGFVGTPSPELRLLGATTSSWNRTDGKRSVELAKVFTGSVLASRWGTERILDTVLDDADLHNGVRGFHAGAKAYFGKDVADLDYEQLRLLLTVRAFSFIDPWCEPEHSKHVSLLPAPAGHRCEFVPQ